MREKSATLSVVNDVLSEGNETLTIQLGSLNDSTGQATLGSRLSTLVTIADDDIDLSVSTTESANVIVAGSGTNLTYTVTVTNLGLTTATGVVLAEDRVVHGHQRADVVLVEHRANLDARRRHPARRA